MRIWLCGSLGLLLGAAALPARAQAAGGLPPEIRGPSPGEPARALERFERALAADSLDYEANWRAAVAAVELGQETPDSVRSPARDSLYARAVHYGRRAVAVDSAGVDGYFALAMALGRGALTRGRKERLQYAVEIHAAASRALELAPDHDGAHHVMGLWNAEVMRTSGFNRFMAKNILGAKVLGKASWDRAIEHLERAVTLDPTRIYHRLDLARVYAERKRYDAAREQLARIADLSDRVPLDSRYREEAERLRQRIADKEDRSHPSRAGGA